MSAATCECRRMYRKPSMRSVKPVSAVGQDADEAIGAGWYRVRPMKKAETKNDAALIAKATFRPASAVTTPPTDAPIASMADHVALDSALAGSSSSAVVKLGIIAVRAGSKNAAALTVNAITRYAIQT